MAFQSYSTVILATTGLQHYYRLGESSGNFADSQGAETLTAAGTIAYKVPGALNNDLNEAISTIGGTTGIATNATHTALAGAADFSFEAWVSFTSTLLNAYFFDEGDSANANPLVGLATDTVTAGKLRFTVRNFAGTITNATTANAYNDGKYHYVTLQGIRATNVINLFVDDPTTAVATTSAYPTGAYNINQFAINGLFRNTTSNFMPTVIDEVATYNVALSTATMRSHIVAAIKGNPALFF